jgi:hypothetical protein
METSIFTNHYLVNIQHGNKIKTVVASTCREPTPGFSSFAFIGEIDDFKKITVDQILATAKRKIKTL